MGRPRGREELEVAAYDPGWTATRTLSETQSDDGTFVHVAQNKLLNNARPAPRRGQLLEAGR